MPATAENRGGNRCRPAAPIVALPDRPGRHLKADLPSDPEALKAFAPAFQVELYAKTLHLEKLRAQLAVLKRARYGRSSELDGEIELLELTIGELEEGAAESQARTAAAAQTSVVKPPRPRREASGRQPLPEPCRARRCSIRRRAYAGNAGIERDLPPVDPGAGQFQRLAAPEGRFDYLLVGSTGVSETLPAAETRLGRRTVLTFPLLPPPQKNWSALSDSSPDTPTPGDISSLSRTSPVRGSTRLKSLSSPSRCRARARRRSR
jgi:hypothetical protein